MYNIKTLNSISHKGLERFSSALFNVDDEIENCDGILVRSAAMHDMPLSNSTLAIARAGAGVNNIPVDKCSQSGIVVFNTPGANANAVKELVLCALVLSSRNVLKAADWAKTLKDNGSEIPKLVEKGKGQFTGPELYGKTLGVIGLGAIGVKVANAATHFGMEVLGYDPYISIQAAWNLSRSVKHCVNLSDLISKCDYITLHLPVTADTKHFINDAVIGQMKHGVRVLNFARAELVNVNDIKKALKTGRVASYVVDFPDEDTIDAEGVISIPHLGASTPESEENCAVMAVDQLSEYLLTGNIENSVNFPSISMPKSGACRICALHKNSKGILAGLTEIASNNELNIENMVNKSRGEYAYTMIDINCEISEAAKNDLMKLDGVIRVRII